MNDDKSILDCLAKQVEVKRTIKKLANTPNDPTITLSESFDFPINSIKKFVKFDWGLNPESRQEMVNAILKSGMIRRIL